MLPLREQPSISWSAAAKRGHSLFYCGYGWGRGSWTLAPAPHSDPLYNSFQSLNIFSYKKRGKGLFKSAYVHARVLRQFSCLTFCGPVDCSLPGSSVLGILQARIPLPWSGLPFSPPGVPPAPGTEPMCLPSPALAGGFFTSSTTWETQKCVKRHLLGRCTAESPFSLKTYDSIMAHR